MLNDPILNTFFSLLLIVAVLAGILFYVKKLALKYSKNKFNSTGVEILSKIPLQPKTNLFVVKVYNKKLLIGVSENSIQTLAEITDEGDIKPQLINKKLKSVKSKASTKELRLEDSLSFREFLNQTFRRS